MNQEKWTAVDDFLCEKLLGDDEVLDAAIAESTAAGLPPIAVSPAQGKLLNMFARLIRARRILEIGTLGGYSTIWLARGLARDGKVITLELDPRHAEVARRNLVRAGLGGSVQLVEGAALDTLPQVEKMGMAPFDLVFIDADKANIPAYFDWALRLTRPGSVIIVDNVVREGAVLDADSDDAAIQGVRRFLEMVSQSEAVTGTSIQTVGVKGYDGFAVLSVADT